jgi:hypothetical protein
MRRVLPAVAVLAAMAGRVTMAQADEKQQCAKASERGQELRDDGKYRSAREAFKSCSRPSCPMLVQSDCIKWLADLDATSPSVVIVAKDGKGSDVTAVTVAVDGAPLTTALDGRPLLVDPGEHEFRYEARGFPAQNARIVIHAGEKSRLLTVQFPASEPSAGSPTSVGKTGGDAPVGPPEKSALPTIGWISIGVGAAMFVGAGVSYAVRQSALNDAQSLCAGPNYTRCPPNNPQLESDQTRGQTASTLVTVFGILGAVGVIGGLVLLTTSQVHASQSRLVIAPTLGGAYAAWLF